MKLPGGVLIVQEVEGRFGTTNDVVNRLVKSSKYVPTLLGILDKNNAFKMFD